MAPCSFYDTCGFRRLPAIQCYRNKLFEDFCVCDTVKKVDVEQPSTQVNSGGNVQLVKADGRLRPTTPLNS